MPNSFKVLIATTCVVMISTAAYFVSADMRSRPSGRDALLAQHEKVIVDFDKAYGIKP